MLTLSYFSQPAAQSFAKTDDIDDEDDDGEALDMDEFEEQGLTLEVKDPVSRDLVY